MTKVQVEEKKNKLQYPMLSASSKQDGQQQTATSADLLTTKTMRKIIILL